MGFCPKVRNFPENNPVERRILKSCTRKGLADTALKTADAGYLTRRLVDVSHDVIINEEDCGTLRGLIATAIKSKDEVVESLGERILGRTSVHDVFNPLTGELIIPAGEEITEDIASLIESLPIEQVEIRSVLTCESRQSDADFYYICKREQSCKCNKNRLIICPSVKSFSDYQPS